MAYGIIEDGGGVWTNQPKSPVRVSREYGNAIVFCGSAPHNNWNGAGAFSLVGSPLQESSLIGVGPRLDGYTQSINLGRKIISAQGTALMLAVNCSSLYAFTTPFAQSSTDGGAGIGLGVYGGDFAVAANAAPLNDPGGTGTKMFGGTWGPAGVKAYRNGQLQSTNAYTGAPTAASGPYYMNIGTFQFTGGNVLSHKLTPIYLLLTDVVLTADQILELWVNPWKLFEANNDPVFYSLAGGSNNTGTLSSTLDAAALTGIGAVTRSGTLAVTLDAVTLAGTGTAAVTNKTGTLAVTLDAATLAGIGGVTRSGTLSSTLDAATLSGAGTVAVGTNRDGTLASTLADVTLTGVGAVTRSGTLSVTLDAATLAGIGTAGQAVTGTLSATLDNVRLTGIGAIPAAPSTGGGKTTGKNLSRKQKKKLKAVESQEWLKAEETARQLLSDRFTKQTPQEKAQALETYIESLQPVIEALKALTSQIEEVVEEAPVIELTPHQEVIQRFDRLEKKVKSVEELVIILMADL